MIFWTLFLQIYYYIRSFIVKSTVPTKHIALCHRSCIRHEKWEFAGNFERAFLEPPTGFNCMISGRVRERLSEGYRTNLVTIDT